MQVLVARIGKPHGIRGEVTVELFTDSPQIRFARGEKLSIENFSSQSKLAQLAPAGDLTVASARWNKKILVVRFDEVTDRNSAELLRNTRLVFEGEQAEGEGYYEQELVGLAVYLADQMAEGEEPTGKSIGRVSGLQPMPAQDLLILELHNGQEAMVPFVDQLVPVLNRERGYVVLDPPPGLLNIGDEMTGQEV